MIRVASTEKGLALLALPSETSAWFEDMLQQKFSDYEITTGGEFNQRVEREITEYFAGRRRRFELKLDLQAPPFHAKVLREVSRIPFGKTKTYGQIAGAVKNPAASRAVGTANARNLIPIVIPCHRVVSSTGLGGYGGGLPMKRFLLRLESIVE
ncbi:MAG: methylated-DNA--[protein]-cysteine S-methyltransferase [candidate division Zixibacteria bacterium]|nr:methylated-DNA--[protein]-cysteine S-methyltransferase [candidate division Zixibacteria bacterium]